MQHCYECVLVGDVVLFQGAAIKAVALIEGRHSAFVFVWGVIVTCGFLWYNLSTRHMERKLEGSYIQVSKNMLGNRSDSLLLLVPFFDTCSVPDSEAFHRKGEWDSLVSSWALLSNLFLILAHIASESAWVLWKLNFKLTLNFPLQLMTLGDAEVRLSPALGQILSWSPSPRTFAELWTLKDRFSVLNLPTSEGVQVVLRPLVRFLFSLRFRTGLRHTVGKRHWVDRPERRYVNTRCRGILGVFLGFHGFGIYDILTMCDWFYSGFIKKVRPRKTLHFFLQLRVYYFILVMLQYLCFWIWCYNTSQTYS